MKDIKPNYVITCFVIILLIGFCLGWSIKPDAESDTGLVTEFQELMDYVIPVNESDSVTVYPEGNYIYFNHTIPKTIRGNTGTLFRWVLNDFGAIIRGEIYE